MGRMTDAERAKLTSVSFMFTTPPELVKPPPMDWEVGLKALQEFKNANGGKTRVPEKSMFDNGQGGQFDLAKWTQRQRQLYKNTYTTPGQRKNFGKLTEDRKVKLASLNFDFEK